jgi:PPOX class probable F420-dependent enzyme
MASRATMMDDEARAILEGRHVGVLGTLMRGAPALACVWYGFDGEDVIVATPAGRRKDRNVRDDGRVSLLIDVRDGEHGPAALAYKGVEIRGVAAMEDDLDGRLRRAIVRRYLDPIPPEFEARIAADERRIIRIRPTRVRVWDFSRR